MSEDPSLAAAWDAMLALDGQMELRPERRQLWTALLASLVLVGAGALLVRSGGGVVHRGLGWCCVALFGAALVTVMSLLVRPRPLLRATAEHLELLWPGQPLVVPWSQVTGATMRTVSRYRRNLYVLVTPSFQDDARTWSSRARRAEPDGAEPFRGYAVPGLLPAADEVARWIQQQARRLER